MLVMVMVAVFCEAAGGEWMMVVATSVCLSWPHSLSWWQIQDTTDAMHVSVFKLIQLDVIAL